MRAEPVIIAEGLGRRFGDAIAVQDLTLAVHPGEVFGFLGHNGAGKTTTVRLLNGVLAPSAGSARVLGLDPLADGSALRRRTGVLTETPSLDERLTARENLSIYAELYDVPRAEVATRVEAALVSFELAERAGEKVGGYSKGMKQRVALARALIHSPDILFLDEPTAGLDPVAAHQVHQLIARLSREEQRTVLLCTHNLAEAQLLCDRVAVLEHGHLLALGTPAELAHRWSPARWLELEVDPDELNRALAVVRAMPGIGHVAHEGGTVRLQGLGRQRVPELVAALVAAGVSLYRVTPQEPTLEEAYFALYGVEEGTR